MKTKGRVIGVNGNMVTIKVDGNVLLNEVAYINTEGKKLKSEIIRIQGENAQAQVFEITTGVGVGDEVDFTGEMLTVDLGPGLLSSIYDGLQNPLPELAKEAGVFLERGIYIDALDYKKSWEFTPIAKVGDRVIKADYLGFVKEGIFDHKIMVPFHFSKNYTVKSIAEKGQYKISDTIAQIADEDGNVYDLTMVFKWPVKRAIDVYEERLRPNEPMVTLIRLIDTFFPVAKGGTYCIPGPFGAGKTVLQQATSRNAGVDIVILAACGERAGEVVETLKEFPELIDPRTGKSLMDRTIIISNTSSMPVASREASVYTAVTIAEYYRQMGLDVLLLADSTSRWAQAMREMSGRLEEIPGEEAFPAYLESTIAGFYERAGQVRLRDGATGSVTIGGTVSPAGGNFEEPVTQATLKVVGAFHGLSRERSDARKYPAIDPIDSWSQYKGIIPQKHVDYVYNILKRGNEVEQMMKVVGEEGTSIGDFITYMKAEYIDAVYFQQNSFDEVDSAVSIERQKTLFIMMLNIASANFDFATKNKARSWFARLRQATLDLNSLVWETNEYNAKEKEVLSFISEELKGNDEEGLNLIKSLEADK